MGLLLIILCAAAIGILAFTFFEKYMDDGCIVWIIIVVISIILAINGDFFAECEEVVAILIVLVVQVLALGMEVLLPDIMILAKRLLKSLGLSLV